MRPRWSRNTIKTPDIFGRVWKEVPLTFRCLKCGQPNFTNSCTHKMIPKEEVISIYKGKLRKSGVDEFPCPICGAGSPRRCRRPW